MQAKALIPVLLVLLLVAGCGNEDLKDDVSDNAARLEKLSHDIDAATSTLDSLRGDLASRITKVEDNTKEILDLLGQKATIRTTTVEPRDPGEGEPEALAENLDSLGYDISSMTESLQALTEQLTEMKEKMDTFTAANEEVQRAAERRQQWEDMNDPAKLASKIEEFSKAYSEKMTAAGTSPYDFQQDMAAFKSELEQNYTTDELATKYKTELEQRIAETEDERMKGFLQRRLDELNSAQGDELAEQVQNFQRFSNMREISEIAEKYEIPRDDLRESGLMVWGRPGGGGRVRRDGGPGGRRGGGDGRRGGGDGGN